ncbi:3-oxoacyl-(acyl-carrier-protein) synthase II [uncultured delta proteobacterium]|uniref:3-oxoacyl-[acyl-carrier-protein] synthase 2 n=1 Tax=uncultured delta proteobacterium TaxID=34034 RepID=A0A212KC52_9DELT|nr:3-oxoacyl-(acyl-carrier-protein) synthase II [uncultured delta proteobacterium]
MSKKRVVVTGLSAITPLGGDVVSSWDALLAGKSGIAPITAFDASAFAARIAGEVKDFDPEKYGIAAKAAKRMDRFVQLSAAGGLEVLKDANYTVSDENAKRTAILLGVGLGGLSTIEAFHTRLVEAGPNKVSPFFIPMLISNMAPGQIAMLTGIKGSNLVMTSACSSGLHAIGHAYTEIVMGRCDAAITGGTEAVVTPMGISGFTALKALSTRNDEPEKASRPFDKDRDGFVMGEGCGMLMLESLESAKARGAKIYAEVCGFGATCDAFHMTAPDENGEGLAQAMRNAMSEGGVKPEDVDHINAHGTSTPMNDACETRAIKAAFGPHAYKLAICANKSQTGHLLGGAGGLESVFTVLALQTGVVPGTLNLENPDEECDLNCMADGPKKLDPRYALCNSAGFGGTNVSILYKKWEE